MLANKMSAEWMAPMSSKECNTGQDCGLASVALTLFANKMSAVANYSEKCNAGCVACEPLSILVTDDSPNGTTRKLQIAI